jgi:hypothetical protein
MKPNLDWTKSQAEAPALGAALIQFAFLSWPAVEGAPAVNKRSTGK